jgi:hypothetical protein
VDINAPSERESVGFSSGLKLKQRQPAVDRMIDFMKERFAKEDADEEAAREERKR